MYKRILEKRKKSDLNKRSTKLSNSKASLVRVQEKAEHMPSFDKKGSLDKSSSYNKKRYYNNDDINMIRTKIGMGDYHIATLLLKQYMEKYPEDEIADLYMALIYACTDRKQEAYELAVYTYEGNRYHDKKSRYNATTVYADILYRVGRIQECEEVLKNLIAQQDINSYHDNFLMAVTNLTQIYLDNNRYDDLVKLIESDKRIYSTPLYIARLAQAYEGQGRIDDAIQLLEKNVDSFEPIRKSHAHYLLGKYYFQKYIDGNDFSLVMKARDHFHKSLNKKSAFYYTTCYQLANIYRLLSDYQKSIYYADLALNSVKSPYPVEDYDIDNVYLVKVYLYIKMFDFNSALVFIEKITDEYTKTRAQIFYYYTIGEYETCINYCCKALSMDREGYMKAHLEFYINSLIRLGRYDQARYTIDCLRNVGQNELSKDYAEKARTFIDLTIYRPVGKVKKYTSKQMISYDEDVALAHIYDRHMNQPDASFETKEQVKKLYDFARENIDPNLGTPSGLLDVHHFAVPNCGVHERGSCDGLRVVTIPGTNNIITMYPVIEARAYNGYTQNEGSENTNGKC